MRTWNLKRWAILALLLASGLAASGASAFDIFPFTSMGPEVDLANGLQLYWNFPPGRQLFLTTEEGFLSYHFASGQWIDHTRPGWIGVSKYAVVPYPGQPDRLALGGVNAWFKGTLDLSLDGGESEQRIYDCTGGKVTDMALATYPDTVIFACTASDVADGELLHSDDAGESYLPLFGHGHHYMTGVEVLSSQEIYVSGDNYLTRSLDGGFTWENLQGNLPAGQGLYCVTAPRPVSSLPDPRTAPPDKDDPWIEAGLILVSNDTGVYRTSAQEIDWQLILPIDCRAVAYRFVQYDTFVYWSEYYAVTFDGRLMVCYDGRFDNWVDATDLIAPGVPIDVVVEGGPVYVATREHGVFSTPGIDGLSPAPPSVPQLSLTARPNPFNPATEIVFSVPRDGQAVIEVFDLAGRQVDTVFQGEVAAGPHTVTWQPRSLASGVYHAVLRQNGRRSMVRVTLIK